MPDGADRQEGRFRREVGEAERRKLAARGRARSVLHWIGMFGLVGWSIALPTLLGAALGRWLDRRASTGARQVSWTLTMILVGLALGCGAAWYWIQRESRRRS